MTYNTTCNPLISSPSKVYTLLQTARRPSLVGLHSLPLHCVEHTSLSPSNLQVLLSSCEPPKYMRMYTSNTDTYANSMLCRPVRVQWCESALQIAVAGKHSPCLRVVQWSPSTRTAAPGQMYSCLHRKYHAHYSTHIHSMVRGRTHQEQGQAGSLSLPLTCVYRPIEEGIRPCSVIALQHAF